jgi:methyl-accepting chemotaxis protein
MVWLWKACLTWFGNLPLKTKLHISFGWLCFFTVVLGSVCLVGIQQVREVMVPGGVPSTAPSISADASATIHNQQSDDAAKLSSTVDHVIDKLRYTIISLHILIVFVYVLMAWRLTQLISRPILYACAVLQRLAQHDLTVSAPVESTDEVGQMSVALNTTIGHLHGILRSLQQSAQSLANSAQGLADETSHTTANCNRQSELAEQVLRST